MLCGLADMIAIQSKKKVASLSHSFFSPWFYRKFLLHPKLFMAPFHIDHYLLRLFPYFFCLLTCLSIFQSPLFLL